MTIQTDPDRTDDRGTWASMLREHFVALDVRDSAAEAFRGDVAAWSLGHLKLARVRSRPQVIDRSSALVRSDHRAYLQVGRMRSGHAMVRQDGREACLGPGDFVVYETTRPFTWDLRPGSRSPVWELDVFTWPRDTIPLGESDTPLVTATAMPGGSGLSAIVSHVLRDLMIEQPALEAPRAAALADEVGNLLAVLTSTIAPEESRRPEAALLGRIEAYIEEHLDDPDLTPETIARANAVSLRHLHRLFAEREHTVSRTIRVRRLERCRRDLVAPANDARSITDVARRWGFTDLGVFGRAFREAYGVSPGHYRLDGAPARPAG